MLMQVFKHFLSRMFNLESDETKYFSTFPIARICC